MLNIRTMLIAITILAPLHLGAEPRSFDEHFFTGQKTVISRADILLSGVQTVGDLITSRTSFNAFGISRSWDEGSTGIFVNGRPSSVSLSSMPLTAVERIEILGGSVAGYFGQEGAGAINIVTRDEDGLEVQASALLPVSPGGDERNLSLSWGGELVSGNINIGLHHFAAQEIAASARDYSRAKWTKGGSFANTAGINRSGNTVYVLGQSTRATSFGKCSIEDGYTGVLTNPPGVQSDSGDTGCGFVYADYQWSTLWDRKNLITLSFDLPTDHGPEVYADVLFLTASDRNRYAPAPDNIRFVPTATQRSDILTKIFGSNQADWPSPEPTFLLLHRFIGHGNREWDTDSTEYVLNTGVRGEIGDSGLGYDFSVGLSRIDRTTLGGPFIDEDKIKRFIQDGKYDLENPKSTDADHLAAIRESTVMDIQKFTYDLKVANASMNGEFGSLPGGPIIWRGGVEYSAFELGLGRTFQNLAGEITAKKPLGTGAGSYGGKRKTGSIFAEGTIPAFDSLDVVLAARQDRHNDVGQARSFRAESRFEVNESITLRAAWGDSALPPSLRLLTSSPIDSYPYICDTRNFSGNGACRRFQVRRVSRGNSALKPYREKSLSFGTDFKIGPVVTSLEWFRIRRANQPTTPSAQQIMDLEATNNLPEGVTVDRSGDIVIYGSVANIGESEFKGVRGQIGGEWLTDIGVLGWTTRFIRTNDVDVKVAGAAQPGHRARNRLHNTLRLTRGNVTVNLESFYRSKFSDQRDAGTYPAWIGHDITLAWKNPFGADDVTLLAGVLNATNKGPSVNSSDPSDAVAQIDAVRGRSFFVGVTQRF